MQRLVFKVYAIERSLVVLLSQCLLVCLHICSWSSGSCSRNLVGKLWSVFCPE